MKAPGMSNLFLTIYLFPAYGSLPAPDELSKRASYDNCSALQPRAMGGARLNLHDPTLVMAKSMAAQSAQQLDSWAATYRGEKWVGAIYRRT